jgi:hypothetical protein
LALVVLAHQMQLLLELQTAVILFLVLLLLQAEVVVVVVQRPQVLGVLVAAVQTEQMQVEPQVHQAKETLVVALQAQGRLTSLPLAVVVQARLVQVLAQVGRPAPVVLV